MVLAYEPKNTKTTNITMTIITTEDIPIYHHPRRLPFIEREIVDKQNEKLWINRCRNGGEDCTKDAKERVREMVLAYEPKKTKTTNVTMKIITTEDIPIYHHPRRLPFTEREIVNKQVVKDRELLVVPKDMQVEVIRSAHERGHFACRKTRELIEQEYFIPGLQSKVERFITNCVPCIMEENRRIYNSRRKDPARYEVGDLVAIKRTQQGPGLKLRAHYLGPYQVTKVKPYNSYDVIKEGRQGVRVGHHQDGRV
ncbi:Integrase zinc binding domain [Popillia japonica]|uniref:RNA-directed DNA polymerase n=1 Tax=Popillia japonica TaxID=7064 RepID=A0AAW1KK45_POPJA